MQALQLQLVGREVCERLKEGESDKEKEYSALVWTSRPLLPAHLAALEAVRDLVRACRKA